MKLIDIIFILIIFVFILILILIRKRRKKENPVASKCKFCPYAGSCSKRKNKK